MNLSEGWRGMKQGPREGRTFWAAAESSVEVRKCLKVDRGSAVLVINVVVMQEYQAAFKRSQPRGC